MGKAKEVEEAERRQRGRRRRSRKRQQNRKPTFVSRSVFLHLKSSSKSILKNGIYQYVERKGIK
ncbi:hypothetical protein SLEP1_g56448 [Rubroshorea leprosula]|uniref:Uncharacterized protein n=1 Tax=Rubroshorea leprosula TaxID=152421 RepID=A0AAV5MJM0_9ROSI|nr:hypothetical protein SLEP1_g56448 [Rubroshorea leprosula]